jgi:phosphatidylserine/phosphatidylglycerophosphate/cardiolipin synthase-like enzyme
MDTKVYFKNIRPQILKELNAAEVSIFAAVAWFTDQGILELLCEKARNGISVVVLIMDDEINAKAKPQYDCINHAGGRVFLAPNYDGESLMHNKFCVIDEKTVITGSYNWTYRASRHNEENIIVITDAVKFADKFIKNFHDIVLRYFPSTIFANEIRGIVPYIDPEISALRFEIDLRTLELEKLRFEEVEIEKIIFQFNMAYMKELGSVVEEILLLKKERARLLLERSRKVDVDSTKLSSESERLENEYVEAEREWSNYKNATKEHKQQEPIQILTAEENKELEKNYRKAAHLCHPDKFQKDMKKRAEAERIFDELTKARKHNDLKKVTQMLSQLERGVFVTEILERTDDKESLRHKLQDILDKIGEIQKRLKDIQNNEAYIVATSTTDLGAYLKQQKLILKAVLASIKQEIASLKEEEL